MIRRLHRLRRLRLGAGVRQTDKQVVARPTVLLALELNQSQAEICEIYVICGSFLPFLAALRERFSYLRILCVSVVKFAFDFLRAVP